MAQKYDRNDPEKPLTAKQKAFCEEYVANGYNGAHAYWAAYNPDANLNVACASASKFLKNPAIKKYIAELQKAAFEAACITAERVGIKLGEIAFADKGDEYYTAQAQLKALDLLQKQLGVQKTKVEADVSTNITINVEE